LSGKINLTVLEGHLTRDPELRYTPSGAAICEFTIANSETWKDASTGEKKEKPTFVNCICWGKQGENISEYFSKGKPIQVIGRLELQQWETKEGEKRSMLKIKVRDFFFVYSKDGGASSGGADNPSFPGGAGPTAADEEEIPF
jgi:single-strand DNA-binding protein